MVLDSEVSDIRFFPENCSFWFVATFFQEAHMAHGRSFVKFLQSKGSHMKDVISLDINEENALATASIDNIVSFWNT